MKVKKKKKKKKNIKINNKMSKQLKFVTSNFY